MIYGDFFELFSFFRFFSKNTEFETPFFIENISHKMAKFCHKLFLTVLTATLDV
jgi:hypothetical protein